jgi:CHAT domain-containing protein
LYKKIWQPLEKHVEGIQNIYYSPSGLLHKVSFAAISKDNNVFLCDNYQLHQQSSTGKVALPSNVMYDGKDQFLLIGGVQYNTDKTKKEVWNYLPGTLNETDNIQSFLEKKKHSVNLFAANDANETNFKTQAQNANVLHISTHGFFFPDPEQVRQEAKKDEVHDENIIFRGSQELDSTERSGSLYANWSFVINKNPLMRSGLVLAGANDVWQRNALEEGEDGILTAQEVSNLDLRNTKLVVLSACETGLGDIKGSEGVYGLQRAFKMAGAEYLIMSLWQVPDKETAEFMELFYKNLVKLKNIPKAFNQTQQTMRKKYDPYYWAAFSLRSNKLELRQPMAAFGFVNFIYEIMNKLKLLILATVFIISSNLNAQSSLPKAVADSLWAVWQDESYMDTSRIDALQHIAWYVWISKYKYRFLIILRGNYNRIFKKKFLILKDCQAH